ncbi:glycosyltransferase [Thioflavicoccus mobilis 8321]|uniref:Glycosyltransferase n=1 Tax=Thioflavicoccus mobilis 8321 TaxID=765912 RepID=L0GWS9_9GAMM|nr:glycosyltransferase [Thioflavicoccus mobilis]AGA89825.1 glycosyltransferase [Thioflavicoccus mobilis 8321]
MRLIHVVPRITSEASGPAYSVMALCGALREQGTHTRLGVVEPAPDRALPEWVQVFPNSGGPFQLGRSKELHRWLRAAVERAEVDIMHCHSLWMMPNMYPGWVTQGRAARLVVSPRGTLSEWALNHSRWKKRVIWPLLQGPAVRHAACFHATGESEYEDIRRAGFRQPVCIIPNGIEIPLEGIDDAGPRGPRRLLFLGRLHPVKGIENLIRAWSAVEHRFPDWELEIVGPDDIGHLARLKALRRELRLRRVNFRGPAFGLQKWQAYQAAELYVLPTHSENFGMTVAEALAAGTPVIVTKGAPWQGLETHQAGWWIDIGVDPLVACLKEALSCAPDDLRTRGANGRGWMKDEFSWRRIGAMMLTTYTWLLTGGEPPRHVKVT